MAMLIVVSCSQYEKDDTPDLPQGYLKVPIGKTIKRIIKLREID